MTAMFCGGQRRYWDQIAAQWRGQNHQALWRAHCDAVNARLLLSWLAQDNFQCLLKSDLFDEACGEGLYSLLASQAQRIIGVDMSGLACGAARRGRSGLWAVGADVRWLPFQDGRFDAMVSISTLDHLASLGQLFDSLAEFHRVLRPGGRLSLTLDNPANPLIALRNALPFLLLNRLGLVPYQVGPSLPPQRLCRRLGLIGFRVIKVEASMHVPRVLAVTLSRILWSRLNAGLKKRYLNLLMSFEHLKDWPTRFATGHYVVVRAVKLREGE